MTFSHRRSDFPEGFVFGAATAAYQIEGGQGPETGRGSCHWDTFGQTRGNTKGLEDGRVACDHYNRWPEDLDLLKSGNFDAYRFSFAWPRLLPRGRGAVNQKGVDFYDRLIDGMLERGLRPFGTAYHWDLPSELADLGGWANASISDWFADYCSLLGEKFGDRLESMATLNEPWCIAWLSHAMGIHAPGLRDLRAAARAMHHTMVAHGKGVQALRATAPNLDVGIVLNFEKAEPADASPEAAAAAAVWHGLYNEWYVGGAVGGAYPAAMTEALATFLPAGWQDEMEQVQQPLDFLGVNYYTRARLAGVDSPGFPALQAVPGELEKTDMGWEIYPQGLEDILLWLHQSQTGDLPIFVTENGMAGADPSQARDGIIDDTQRLGYFESHLDACRRAIKAGVPLRGYFAWSLLDNFEWAEGYAKRFGLVRVDYDSQERTPKASFEAFRLMLATNL